MAASQAALSRAFDRIAALERAIKRAGIHEELAGVTEQVDARLEQEAAKAYLIANPEKAAVDLNALLLQIKEATETLERKRVALEVAQKAE